MRAFNLARNAAGAGHEPMLEQALTHLLTTALLYAPRSKPEIVISPRQRTTMALCVKDNGIGIRRSR